MMELAIDPLNREIIRAVGRMTRAGIAPVYPKHLCAWLPVDVSYRTVRKRMARLSNSGHIERYGYWDGYGPVKPQAEKLRDKVTQAIDYMAQAERALKEAAAIAAELARVDVVMEDVA